MKEQRPFLARIGNPNQLKSCLGEKTHKNSCKDFPRGNPARAPAKGFCKVHAWVPAKGVFKGTGKDSIIACSARGPRL